MEQCPAISSKLNPRWKEWMQQWREAGPALARQKLEELRALSETQALQDSNMLLSSFPEGFHRACDAKSSGMVDQQRFFSRSNTCPRH